MSKRRKGRLYPCIPDFLLIVVLLVHFLNCLLSSVFAGLAIRTDAKFSDMLFLRPSSPAVESRFWFQQRGVLRQNT